MNNIDYIISQITNEKNKKLIRPFHSSSYLSRPSITDLLNTNLSPSLSPRSSIPGIRETETTMSTEITHRTDSTVSTANPVEISSHSSTDSATVLVLPPHTQMLTINVPRDKKAILHDRLITEANTKSDNTIISENVKGNIYSDDVLEGGSSGFMFNDFINLNQLILEGKIQMKKEDIEKAWILNIDPWTYALNEKLKLDVGDIKKVKELLNDDITFIEYGSNLYYVDLSVFVSNIDHTNVFTGVTGAFDTANNLYLASMPSEVTNNALAPTVGSILSNINLATGSAFVLALYSFFITNKKIRVAIYRFFYPILVYISIKFQDCFFRFFKGYKLRKYKELIGYQTEMERSKSKFLGYNRSLYKLIYQNNLNENNIGGLSDITSNEKIQELVKKIKLESKYMDLWFKNFEQMYDSYVGLYGLESVHEFLRLNIFISKAYIYITVDDRLQSTYMHLKLNSLSWIKFYPSDSDLSLETGIRFDQFIYKGDRDIILLLNNLLKVKNE